LPEDMSNGYEAATEAYMAARSTSGQALIQRWADTFAPGASVLDIGAGYGKPLTAVLIRRGLDVSAVDASPAMVSAFQQNFPGVTIACEPVETSRFFNQAFDGILAVGLLFLLPEDSQRDLIVRMAAVLKPEGRLLFSSPRQMCQWTDVLTGLPSLSLGVDEYRRIIANSGLRLVDEHVDEGESYYYEARKGSE